MTLRRLKSILNIQASQVLLKAIMIKDFLVGCLANVKTKKRVAKHRLEKFINSIFISLINDNSKRTSQSIEFWFLTNLVHLLVVSLFMPT